MLLLREWSLVIYSQLRMKKLASTSVKKKPEPKVPLDFRKALEAVPKAKIQWKSLTPIARRDFITWIESAKQAETRQRRIQKACSILPAGKRRPCCYAVVPMDLYQALGKDTKAQTQWKNLTPDERRDMSDWVDSADDTVIRKQRIKQTCQELIKKK